MKLKINLVGQVFSAAAAAALLFYGAIVLKGNQAPEFAAGCDSYGYLTMAESFRQARQSSQPLNFHLNDPQTRELTRMAQALNIPVEKWDEAVAPHAHHYFPISNVVGPQYPPGTGFILSWFTRGQAVRDWNQLSIFCVLGITLLIFAILATRRAWLALGGTLMLSYWVLEVFQQVGDRSYSINCVLLPLTSAYLLAFFAKQSEADAAKKFILEFLSGALLGLSFLVRIPVLFLAPALDFFIHTPFFPRPLGLRALVTPFRVGFSIFGLLPLALHQHSVTGSFLRSTYSRGDNTPPSLDALFKNWDFYLGKGYGSGDNWVILNLALGALGAALLFPARGETGTDQSAGKRTFLAAVLTLATSLAYFMTHSVQVGYYLIPTVLATSLLLVYGIFEREKFSQKLPQVVLLKRTPAFLLALLPMFFGFHHIWLMRGYWSSPPTFEARPTPVLPPEALLPSSLVWADDLSGSIRYYAGKPAFKIPFAEPSVREQLFLELRKLGTTQYLVEDSPTMAEIKEALPKSGLNAIKIGTVSGKPLYRF